MNVQRYKKVQKTIDFFKRNFKFVPPYNLLLDATFCSAALENKVDIAQQMTRYLMADVNIFTTRCIIQEVERLSKIEKRRKLLKHELIFNTARRLQWPQRNALGRIPTELCHGPFSMECTKNDKIYANFYPAFANLDKALYGSWLIVKKFPVHQCGHKSEPKSASECIMSLLGKKNQTRYFLATMDGSLRRYVRKKVTGCPIIYLHGHTPVIERPNENTEKFASSKDKFISEHQKKELKRLEKQFGIEEKVSLVKKFNKKKEWKKRRFGQKHKHSKKKTMGNNNNNNK